MARISTRQLAGICRRMGTTLQAGVDARSAWERESQRGTPSQRSQIEQIAQRVADGDHVADALRDSGGYFPSLACEMVAVGEQTGKLEMVLLQLADHYEHLLKLRRNFLLGIAWPSVQLAAAVLIIGFLIWIIGVIGGENAADILGIGVTGLPAVGIFFLAVALLTALVALPIVAVLQGWLGVMPQRVAMAVPMVGRCMQMMALSRMAWSLSMASDAGMDVRRVMSLSLRSTQLVFYTAQAEKIDAVLLRGGQIQEALRQAEGWPDDFLDAVETGETTGMLSESMARLAADYRDRAQASSGLIAMLASFATWGLMAAMIIFFIIRMFMVLYLGPINSALEDLNL